MLDSLQFSTVSASHNKPPLVFAAAINLADRFTMSPTIAYSLRSEAPTSPQKAKKQKKKIEINKN